MPVRGLQPGADYSYQWESDGKLGQRRRASALRVAGPDRFSFGVIGDFGIGTPAARANLRRLSADPAVDLAITTGDNAQIYGTEDEYRRFVLGPLRDLIATKPFWPSVGNHDYYNLQNYLRFFALPERGPVLQLHLRRSPVRRARLEPLRRASSGAGCGPSCAGRPPAARSPTSTTRCGPAGAATAGTRGTCGASSFVPILERGGVDLVLNGHVQNYERSKPLRSGRRSRRRGIVYVVTGGGGASLNGFVTRRRPKWSARRGVFFHRLRIRVEKRAFRGKAIDAAGNTRDRFRVPCRPG